MTKCAQCGKEIQKHTLDEAIKCNKLLSFQIKALANKVHSLTSVIEDFHFG